MSSDLDKSGERTERIEQKLDTLATSVDRRFDALSASVDERFGAVDEALIEQRQYTEFAFERLRDEMKNGFNGVENRFNGIENGFNGVENRFDRLERKLDQFIDTQSTTNKLVERRLTALEPRSAEE